MKKLLVLLLSLFLLVGCNDYSEEVNSNVNSFYQSLSEGILDSTYLNDDLYQKYHFYFDAFVEPLNKIYELSELNDKEDLEDIKSSFIKAFFHSYEISEEIDREEDIYYVDVTIQSISDDALNNLKEVITNNEFVNEHELELYNAIYEIEKTDEGKQLVKEYLQSCKSIINNELEKAAYQSIKQKVQVEKVDDNWIITSITGDDND